MDEKFVFEDELQPQQEKFVFEDETPQARSEPIIRAMTPKEQGIFRFGQKPTFAPGTEGAVEESFLQPGDILPGAIFKKLSRLIPVRLPGRFPGVSTPVKTPSLPMQQELFPELPFSAKPVTPPPVANLNLRRGYAETERLGPAIPDRPQDVSELLQATEGITPPGVRTIEKPVELQRPPIPRPIVSEPGPFGPQTEPMPGVRPLDLGEVGRRRAVQEYNPPPITGQQPRYTPPPTTEPWEGIQGKMPGEVQRELKFPKIPKTEKPVTPEDVTASVEKMKQIAPEDSLKINAVKNLWTKISERFVSPQARTAGDVNATRVYQSAMDHTSLRDSLREYFDTQAGVAYKPIIKSKESIYRVNKLLDSPNGPNLAPSILTPEELSVYQNVRQLFDQAATSIGLQPGQRVTEYFPRIRQELTNETTKVLKVGDKEFYKTSLESLGRREQNRWFLQSRRSQAPADDLGLNPVKSYFRGISQKIAMEGGVNPKTGEKISGFLNDIQPSVATKVGNKWVTAIDDPTLQDYIGRYVNAVVGTGKPDDFAKLVSGIKSYQFTRTIGGNALSPVVNSTQQLLTFAHTDNPMNFFKAYKDLYKYSQGDRQLSDLVQRAGIRGGLAKGDIDALEKLGQGTLGNIRDTLGYGFSMSEKGNRLQAFFSGYRDALDKKLAGPEALQYARNRVDATQFRAGPEALPEVFRGSGPKQLALQFKSFMYNYAKSLKNMAKDDVVNSYDSIKRFQATGNFNDARQVVTNIIGGKSVKFWGTGAALFGPEAMTLGLVAPDTKDKPYLKGLLPWTGIWLGNQIGLGALPLETVGDIFRIMPGPTGSMFLDAVSIGASAATGRQWDLSWSPQGLFSLSEQGTKPIDEEKFVSKLIRLLPAGVMLDRMRQGLQTFTAEDSEHARRALNYSQALGLEPIPETNPITGKILPGRGTYPLPESLQPESPTARKTLGILHSISGIPTTEQHSAQKQLRDVVELKATAQGYAHKAAEILVSTGDMAEAMKFAESWNKQYGETYPITPSMIRNAVKSTVLTPQQKQILTAPRPLRGRVSDIMEEE